MKKDISNEERKAHYEAVDDHDKIIINLRDMNHTIRFLHEGRGSQKRILIVLLEKGKITQQKLTEHLGIQPGSASEVLSKLEKSGLIMRTESEIDRRTTDVTLTEEGRILAEEAHNQRKERHEEMFSCLSEEEKKILLQLLEKINHDWSERYQSTEKHHHKHPGHHHHHPKEEP